MRKLSVRCVRQDCTRRSAVASKVTTDNDGARAVATIRAYLATIRAYLATAPKHGVGALGVLVQLFPGE
jgi:hypothetical protein